mmetsp:Transcript_95634/g.270634  ORF Transcript_95634/g.270634 Transcript_95634/m.270634 type:complete len:487 (-) Transcript_95634:74-1534(-)|eukprot:CAMPEP_0117505554 /NCGR_PEP_ID=MMETSP0784-20121206/25441_1 /TAXON_ID=39447 /ORGANISM="" /LENGTH=486 /DNA_ID=CAMNT_0005300977 /DNA_START=193 /DNA_END=1653 /DNA_ORIENTATION=-
MGSQMQKPVESTVVERHASEAFHVGVAEMNGWRCSMEDAHFVHMRKDWGFFGVLDGHGGDQCSAFVAKLIGERLEEHGCPNDDVAVKKLILDVDQAFLDTNDTSGSTAAMCIVHKPTGGGRHRLRVINVGDSRVLLGRRDGTIVDGGGTDQGLTTDHKPNHPDERERICRCGGTVVEGSNGSLARVNGDLAVSRAFGDANYKKTGGPGPEDRPVTANPDLGRFECNEEDFILLVCDGVSERDFPNAEVVLLAAAELEEHGDPGAAAKAVCHKALERNSRDNVTCMVVIFTSKEGREAHDVELIPGPLSLPGQVEFMKAYVAMARRAGYNPESAVELRYDNLCEEMAAFSESSDATSNGFSSKLEEMKAELAGFGKPPGQRGSDERRDYFERWLTERLSGVSSGLGRIGGGWMRRATVPSLAILKEAVENHPALKWDDRMLDLPGDQGIVVTEDPSDGTSNVRFDKKGIAAWLPTAILQHDRDGPIY